MLSESFDGSLLPAVDCESHSLKRLSILKTTDDSHLIRIPQSRLLADFP
ncbi:MAG: hypothetical protein HQ518_22105 [Rhodopirellula sp.]|nr:hypothetical protein [Rhodopirellula sp.]